jgi:superoxide dismutase
MNVEEAREKCEKYGCDGIMLGRAIFGNPFLFAKQKCPEQSEGRSFDSAQDEIITKKLEVMISHTKLFEEMLDKSKNFAIMKKHYKAYVNGFDGAKELSDESPLKKKIIENQGSFETWLTIFKALAMTRGIGWAVLWYDKKEDRLLNTWVDEQHLGQLQGCTPLLALDMWEHSFVADYQPSGKKQYIEDFFTNLNWEKIEQNFVNAK